MNAKKCKEEIVDRVRESWIQIKLVCKKIQWAAGRHILQQRKLRNRKSRRERQ